MDSTKLTLRPLGPRSITRNASPSSIPLSNTAPLTVRKTPKLSLFPPGPSPSAHPQVITGGIPKPRRANTPSKAAISIAIPPANNDSSLFESYYGGPIGPAHASTSPDPEEIQTIRPPSTSVPQTIHRSGEPLSVRDMLNELEQIRTSVSIPQPNSNIEEDQLPAPVAGSSLPFSDDVLEELSRLGEGAGGAVHKVRDKRTGKIMARKTITTREAPMKQLLRELSIISSTQHINIILYNGAYMSPSSSEVKILMEYCEGGSLEAVGKCIKDRGAIIGEKIVGRLAEGVLQGLAYLHTKKTIHRDIKPSNILISREGVVKLADFGVSGELVNSIAGTFTGTSFYMAPERICGHEYTIRSDVWSTGISLLELVQNRFPYPSDVGPIELMMYITTGEPPRLEDEPGVQWSDDMKDFIKQTLIIESSTRPTPRDMLSHPWIIGVMKQEVNMARWIRQVWSWSKSSRRSRDDSGSLSRPSTGTAESRVPLVQVDTTDSPDSYSASGSA